MSDDLQASSVVAASAEDADEPMAPLERRYRRWLGLFPSAYRADREDELVGVLLDTASPGQERPRLAEVVDLAKAAAVAHVRTVRSSPRRRAWSGAMSGVSSAATTSRTSATSAGCCASGSVSSI